MTDESTNYNYFGASETVAHIQKPMKNKKENYKDIDVDVEKYEKTKVKRKIFRYVPKQD